MHFTALAVLIAITACAPASPQAQRPQPPNTGATVVKQFFAAFGRGDLEGIVATFDPAATITAVRAGARREREVYGSYAGTPGVREFVANLGAAFDTKAFAVDAVAGEGELVFAKGAFSHIVKKTGKTFRSDWALLCHVRNGRIADFQFFEDSAALVAADPSLAVAVAP